MRTLAATFLALTLAACSGDATGPSAQIDRGDVPAQCSAPAPLNGTPDPRVAGRYVVVYKDGTDSPGTTARLARKYGFEPRYVYQHALLGFASSLTDTQVAGVRCEDEVKYVSHDGVVTIG